MCNGASRWCFLMVLQIGLLFLATLERVLRNIHCTHRICIQRCIYNKSKVQLSIIILFS